MLKNHDDAEDCVQEALLLAFARMDQFAGTGSFESWVHTILTNQCPAGIPPPPPRSDVRLL